MTELRDNIVHLSDVRLAAYLDGQLTRDERDQALGHFAACMQCRREMTAARRLLAGRTGSRRNWIGPALAALAATLAVVTVPRLLRDNGPSRSDAPLTASERAAQPDVRPSVPIVSPADQAQLDHAAIVFRWRSAGSDATYRLTLQDATGTVVWDTTVSDTTASLPNRLALSKGSAYFWSVDALLADGRSASAGVHRFTIR